MKITWNSFSKYKIQSFILLTSIALIGCGGGDSGSGESVTPIQNDNSVPQRLSAADIPNAQFLARETYSAPVVTNDQNTITLTHSGSEVSDDLHYQFFINTDNDPSTGFRFENEVWDDAGTDYIIEDGDLFKSTANDATWSWDVIDGNIDYVTTSSSVSVTIDQNLLEGLAPQIRVGFIVRDANWNVVSIWPGSSLMALASIDIEPPVDNIAPVISLNGADNITIQKDSVFTDPGATAVDNFDGDITTRIESTSNLDTSTVGTYTITYLVSDLAENQSTKVRTIIVAENSSDSIVIDGSINDWTEIPVHSSSDIGSIKVTDNIKNIYILIEGYQALGENTQIFIDSDNNTFNGFRFEGQVWSEGGADYMIENNLLAQSTASTGEWSWEHDISPISYIKSNNIIEVAIPKSAMLAKRNLEPTINVGFVNRTADWEIESVLPEAGMLPHKLIAINDLQLISGFCGKIWETDGTAENTQESYLNTYNINNRQWGDVWEKHNNLWYGVQYIENDNGNSIGFLTYRQTYQNPLFLPFNVVRTEPINDGKVTSMKFVGDDLYFIFENELWKYDDSFPVRLKIFDDTSEKYSLLTTSTDVYVHEVIDTNYVFGDNERLVSNFRLWKLANGEFLTEVTADNTDNSSVIGTYGNSLYTAKRNTSGTYSIIQNNSGTETIMTPEFENRPSLSSTNGALYVSDATRNEFEIIQYFWRLNETNNTFVEASQNRFGGAGSASSSFFGMSLIHGNEFVSYRYSAFINAPQASLYQVINSEEREEVLETNSLVSHYLDDDLYLKTTNYQFNEVREEAYNNELHVINDASGQIKKLATCLID